MFPNCGKNYLSTPRPDWLALVYLKWTGKLQITSRSRAGNESKWVRGRCLVSQEGVAVTCSLRLGTRVVWSGPQISRYRMFAPPLYRAQSVVVPSVTSGSYIPTLTLKVGPGKSGSVEFHTRIRYCVH